MQLHVTTISSVGYRPYPTITGVADGRRTFVFGAYTVSPQTRTFARSGKPLKLGGRAFDLLVSLLRADGRLLTKEQIMREVWPTTTVVEANLRVQMAVLRKAIGPEQARIKTVSGRGYMFAMP